MKERNNRLPVSKIFRKELQLHIMVLPAVILVLIFSYFPLYGLKIAFQRFLPVLRNTFIIAGAKIVLNLLVPVTVALMLNELTSSRVEGECSGVAVIGVERHAIV